LIPMIPLFSHSLAMESVREQPHRYFSG